MQDFYEAEYEGNVTEHLSYQCPNCNDTGRVVGFSGHSVPCRGCGMHDYLLSQQQVQADLDSSKEE